MKQKLLILIAAISFAAVVNAQDAKTMYIMHGGKTTTCAVSSIDSITFYNPDPLTIDEGVVINGVKWATRNLDVGGKFVANPEDHGAIFQWGRHSDGHESRTSPRYPGDDNTPENGTVSGTALDANGQVKSSHSAYGRFIKTNASPYDWRSPQDDALWNKAGAETGPVKTANDPCPAGWRIPTKTEFATLGAGTWQTSPAGRKFGSGDNTLFLPAAGRRDNVGTFLDTGSRGFYWSSTIFGTTDRLYYLNVHSGGTGLGMEYRGYGFSCRCVAE